jgi:hypothetical protein
MVCLREAGDGTQLQVLQHSLFSLLWDADIVMRGMQHMGGSGGRNGCDVMEEIKVFLKDVDTVL